MVERRTILGLAGIVAFAVGAAELLAVRVVPVTPDEAVLTLVGIVPLAVSYFVVRARIGSPVERAAAPDPERLVDVGTPGDDFGGTLAAVSGSRGRFVRAGSRWALRDLAASVLARFGSDSPAEALDRVESGEWTENPIAASFLSGRRIPLTTRARTLLVRESAVDRQVRETVDEVVRLAGVEPAGDETDRVGRVGRLLGREPSDGQREPSSPSPARATDGGSRERATGHWRGIGALALVCVGVGVLSRSPAVALTGVVGIGFVAYARAGSSPSTDLAIDRTVSDPEPAPGDEVTVTVEVENRSDGFAPDVRLVDGVPDGLEVSAGSPRVGTAILPGERHRFTYEVTAARGRHEFESALALVGDLPSSVEREVFLDSSTTLTCRPRPTPLASPYPVRRQATRYAGRMSTDESGDGTEFFGIREYRPGDPPGRVDWNRRARTGEFATLEFRSERAARILLVIDARAAAYRAPEPHAEHAVGRSADAAARLFETMDTDGHRVGLASLAPDPCWLEPAAGADHRHRAMDLLGEHPSLSATPPEENTYSRRWLSEFRQRVGADVQPLLLTPLCDDTSANLANTLDAAGYAVTVLSPDPTADRTPGHRLAKLGRRLRVTDLRRADIPVVDWSWNEPVETALARHAERR